MALLLWHSDGFSLQVQSFSARALAFTWCLSSNVMKHLSCLPIILIQIQGNTSSLCCVKKSEPRYYHLSLSPSTISSMRNRVTISHQILQAQVPTYRRTCDSLAISCLFLGKEGSRCGDEWGVPLQKTFGQCPLTETNFCLAFQTPPPKSIFLTRDFSDLGTPRAKPKSANLGTMISRSWQVRQSADP